MNNQSFSKIWIIVILVLFIAGGILAWQYFTLPKEKTPEEKVPKRINEKEKLEEVVKDETANWKTFKSEEYGFEIKYLEDWYTVPVSIFFKPTEQEGIGFANVPKKIEEIITKEFKESAKELQEEIYGLAIRIIYSSIETWLENQKRIV